MLTDAEIAEARKQMAQSDYGGPFHEHDGYVPHSHEVRYDHLGVKKDD
jgi:hypothetical protein